MLLSAKCARTFQAAGLVAVAGCILLVALRVGRRRGPTQPVEAGTAERIDVEFSGCAAVTQGPVCELGASGLIRLWLPGAPPQGILWSTDASGSLEPEATAWPDGVSLRMKVPGGATALQARLGAGRGDVVWSLRLAATRPRPELLERAVALSSAGRLDEAASLLEEGVGADGVPAEERAGMVAQLARVEYARGRAEKAIARYEEAIALREALGRSSEASDDTFALAFLLLEHHRFQEVRRLLARGQGLSRDYADGQARGQYYEGLLASGTGDVRTALGRTHAAEEHAARLGVVRLRRMARQASAWRLEDLGRYREALAALQQLYTNDGADMPECDRAELLDNIGWAAILAREADPSAPSTVDAGSIVTQALALFRQACPGPNRIANALANLAQAELDRGRIVEARAALDEARSTERDPALSNVLFWLHLQGSIALAAGTSHDALEPFNREAELATALGTLDDRRVAAEDRATALVSLGRSTEALAVLDAVDALIDASGAQIPLGEGKTVFFGTHDRAASLRVELLMRQGKATEAMRAARVARARFIATIQRRDALERLGPDARARWEDAVGAYRRARELFDAEASHDWELPSDRLAAVTALRADRASRERGMLEAALAVLPLLPHRSYEAPSAAGEVTLLYFPTAHGWFGFAQDARGVAAALVGAVDPSEPPAELAKKLLSPLAPSLSRALRVRLLPYGALRSVDVQALPWNGEPLLRHAVVEIALDVGAPPAVAAAPLPVHALIVADPGGDLPAAREEADAVAAALLQAPGWDVRTLRGSAATSSAVRSALETATFFHYAGHATFAGADGLESALPLAAGGGFGAGDALALAHAPSYVVLFGCDTGRDSVQGVEDALGIAHAFLVAGARSVIATSRVVDDALARQMAREFYARLVAMPSPDPALALRDAQLTVRERAPSADWAAFRALTP